MCPIGERFSEEKSVMSSWNRCHAFACQRWYQASQQRRANRSASCADDVALAIEHGLAAGYLRLRRLLPSSSPPSPRLRRPREKPIHLRLRLARDTRATTAVEAAVPAAMSKIAALSTPKAFASHYRLNAINFRSLRRCVKASPAIASTPPIHVLGSGTGAAWITVSTMSLASGPPL